MAKVLVITGGSSGIGKAAAELFALRGYHVYELSRSGQSTDRIEHISCDVTLTEQTRMAVDKVVEKEGRVDVLLNNAGYGISGAIEFTDLSDAKRQFDVNFFGALNMVQAVLPQMRKQKAGRIVFTSSVAAVLSIPYQAFYSASKSAINALALALRNEVKDFGITVTALMPGDVATGFTNARSKSQAGSDIYTHMQNAVSAMEKDEQNGMTCEYLARQLYKLATRQNPKPLYTAGLQYRLFVVLEKLLPKRLSNWIVGKLYN